MSLLLPWVEYSPGMDGLLERFSPIFTADQLEEFKREIADSPIHPFWTALLQGLIVGPTVNAIAGFGEEVGWRGHVQRTHSHRVLEMLSPHRIRLGAMARTSSYVRPQLSSTSLDWRLDDDSLDHAPLTHLQLCEVEVWGGSRRSDTPRIPQRYGWTFNNAC